MASARLFDRFMIAIAALVCLLYVGTLRDAVVRFWLPPPLPPIPAAPAGHASLEVHVIDSEGHPVSGAVVRVFHLNAAGEVFLASEKWTKSGESLHFAGLPGGETWVVAYGQEKSRASTRVLLDEGTAELPPPERAVTLALRPASALTVRVVDDDGKPILDASVSVRTTDPLPHVVLTDAEGRATLDRLGPPPWNVTVEGEGYDSVSRSGVYPDVAPLEIKLERLGGFVVLVVDESGEPVPEAEVFLSGPNVWPARSTTTDEEGKVTITGLYAGLYDLKAREGDRISATDLSVPLGHGKLIERTLTLLPGRYVAVTVTDGPRRADGLEPLKIEGASVVAVEQGLSSFPMEARTNKDGVAIIGPMSDGAVTITARAEGFVPRTVGGEAVVDEAVTIPLLKGGMIVGDVRDERNFPIDGATIEVFGTDLDGMPIHESTDRSSFRDDLFAFSLSGPVPLIARGELGVMPGPVPPIPHASVSFDALGNATGGDSGGGEPWVTQTDGTFVASPVTPGRVQVLIKHPEYVEWISDVLVMQAGGKLEVKAILKRGGRLEGRVLEEDRLAVPGARLEVASLEGTFSAVTYTTDDGSFAFASVPQYVLVSVYRGDSEGEVATRMVLELPPDKRTKIEIILAKEREPTSLRFVDNKGFPVSRVEAKVVSLDRDTVLYRTHFTNDDGTVEVRGARGLPLRIVAERPGLAPLVTTIEEAGKEHKLVMEPGLTLEGYVTAKGGRIQVDSASITLYTLAGARHETTDERGFFQVTDLAPGRIRIVTRAENFADDERLLQFEGDGRRPVEIETIDLLASGSVEGEVVDENGDPIAGARVGKDAVPTYLPVGRLPSGIVQTDADGRFELKGLPTGTVTLEAYSPELGRGRSEGIEIREDRVTRRVTITIPNQEYDPRKVRAAGSVAVTLAERDGGVVILDVPEGGEAELASIEPGDRILTIAGSPISTIEQARDGMSGPLGEDIIVELEREQPNGTKLTLKLRVRRESVRR